MKIWFDMDGTLADLYGVENWLPKLRAFDPTPYAEAKPLVNMQALAHMIHNRQKKGYEFGVVSALSKDSNAEYDEAVMNAKREWLKKHMPTVEFDEIRFVPYTFKKNDVNGGDDVLFDDEERHLLAWTGKAIPARDMMKTLKMTLR